MSHHRTNQLSLFASARPPRPRSRPCGRSNPLPSCRLQPRPHRPTSQHCAMAILQTVQHVQTTRTSSLHSRPPDLAPPRFQGERFERSHADWSPLRSRFGKAFCESLSQSVCSNQPCTGCPSHTTKKIPTPPPDIDAETEASLFESLTDLPCCGDPEMCGSLTCGPKKDGDAVESLPRSVPSGVRTAETVPCNEAWTVLKSHPNIAFAGTYSSHICSLPLEC